MAGSNSGSMSMTEGSEELREKHIRDMGPELGRVYHALQYKVALLHLKWDQYRQLYAHSRARMEFLNNIAGDFVGAIQDPLYHDILLHLARLTDEPKKNLTLRRLPKLVPHVLASEVKGLVEAAEKACKSATSARNKHIAHTDLALALAGTFDDLPSRTEVEAALRAVRAVLDRLEAHYWKSPGTQYAFSKGRDADSLVYYLLEGVRAYERRRERLLQGKPLPEDLEPEDEAYSVIRSPSS
jgi:AbiU2